MSADSSLRCIVCGGADLRKIFAKGGRDFFRCHTCSLTRLYPLPAEIELRNYYDREYTLATGMGVVRAIEEEMEQATAEHRFGVIQRYAAGGAWLDIGCATGVFVEQAMRAGINSSGIDISEQAVQKARERNLPAHATLVQNFFPAATYDVVTGFDVIEHLLDPVGFLRNTRRLLRPGGILTLTTPDTNSIFSRLMGRRWYFYIPEEHLFYFNRANLAALLARCGFEIVAVGKARKALNFRYGLIQFKAYNPLVYKFLKFFTRFLPGSWTQKPLLFYIGEMNIVARALP